MTSELPPDAPAPRLCHLIKWVNFDGYGFNLHAEKSRSGQFIGKVDEDSPAQHAGLREGDRIIEVNGVNIAQENHKQVVERIKSIPNETKLLVVDEDADRWYKEKKIVVKSTQSNVMVMKTPIPRPSKEPPSYENITLPYTGIAKNVGNGVHDVKESPLSTSSKHDKHNGHESNGITEETMPAKDVEEKHSPKVIKEKIHDSPVHQKAKEEVSSRHSTPPPMDNTASLPDSPHSTKSSRSTNSIGGGSTQNGQTSLEDGMLNLNMSASEMRQMLANRRKKDPKKEQMDIRQKYEIIQQM